MYRADRSARNTSSHSSDRPFAKKAPVTLRIRVGLTGRSPARNTRSTEWYHYALWMSVEHRRWEKFHVAAGPG